MQRDTAPNLGFCFISAAKELLPEETFQAVSKVALERYDADMVIWKAEEAQAGRPKSDRRLRARSPEEYSIYLAVERARLAECEHPAAPLHALGITE